ncbi:MAG TPA: aspartyl protease family protein [Rhizomicrobium sp.]|jgi:predicted aspartyl protease|nr:aspartyl protease family protein [Rhizomicrobium sp.]
MNRAIKLGLVGAAALACAATAGLAQQGPVFNVTPQSAGGPVAAPAATPPDTSPAIPATPAATPGAPCHQTRVADLELTTEPSGQVAIPVSIDDRTYMLAVDTGTIHTVITSRVADELQLERDLSAQVYVMAGGIPIYQVAYSHSFKVGTMTTGRVGLLVTSPNSLNYDTDGLFGPDAMNNYDVEIDYAHGRFNLYSQDHCPGQVVYWTRGAYAQVPMHVDEDWHISVPLTMDGKPLNAFIDTGAARSFMTLGTVRELYGLTPDSPGMEKRTNVSINGTRPTTIYRYPFGVLNIEGIAVQHPDIEIMPDSALGKDAPPLVIGANVLRQLHLYIAYKEQMLYATPAEAK